MHNAMFRSQGQRPSLADMLAGYVRAPWADDREFVFLAGFAAGRRQSTDCSATDALCAVVSAWLKLQDSADADELPPELDAAWSELEQQMAAFSCSVLVDAGPNRAAAGEPVN